ncbi:MAG: nitrous oxide-stimulated promoter family protein [Flavobacteriales bacterium]|nr:nitrous oxide-stimulated promoter family protein [Flavobacteriales bacterium]
MKDQKRDTQQASAKKNADACSAFMAEQKRVVSMMIQYYCQHHHTEKGVLCPECQKLQEYAFYRLSLCPFKDKKPNCSQCRVHCYSPQMSSEIKKVMKYSGMRMFFYAPKDALVYLFRKMKFKYHKN